MTAALICAVRATMKTGLNIFFASALLFLSLSFLGCGKKSPPPERLDGESITVDVNSLAPAFGAKTLDGGATRLSDYMGSKVVLLEFWSMSCKSCLQEMSYIEALYAKYKEQGFQVLSVNTDVFSSKRINKFLNKLKIEPPYPVLLDKRQEIIKAYNVELLPVTVIIDKNGWIRLYQEGFREGDERGFERTIRRLLGQEAEEDITLASRGGVTSFAPKAALVEKGKKLDSLSALALDGGKVDLNGNRPYILFFWSLYCKPCRAEFPEFEKLAKAYGDEVLRVCSINVDSIRLKKRVEKFVEKYPGVISLLDPPSEDAQGLAKKLGVVATPTVVLINSDGVVAYAKESYIDAEALKKEIARLFEPKAEPGPETKTEPVSEQTRPKEDNAEDKAENNIKNKQ